MVFLKFNEEHAAKLLEYALYPENKTKGHFPQPPPIDSPVHKLFVTWENLSDPAFVDYVANCPVKLLLTIRDSDVRMKALLDVICKNFASIHHLYIECPISEEDAKMLADSVPKLDQLKSLRVINALEYESNILPFCSGIAANRSLGEVTLGRVRHEIPPQALTLLEDNPIIAIVFTDPDFARDFNRAGNHALRILSKCTNNVLQTTKMQF
jgi:hypothetical protein